MEAFEACAVDVRELCADVFCVEWTRAARIDLLRLGMTREVVELICPRPRPASDFRARYSVTWSSCRGSVKVGCMLPSGLMSVKFKRGMVAVRCGDIEMRFHGTRQIAVPAAAYIASACARIATRSCGCRLLAWFMHPNSESPSSDSE